MTIANANFIQDVCYNGAFFLKESIEKGKPEGLKVFGDWPTVYEALSELPKNVQDSWFGFDHFYSDVAFPKVLPYLFKNKPKKILDIGGNTGKFAIQCCKFDPDVEVTIADLPGQLDMATKTSEDNGFKNRIHFYPIDLLDSESPFPKDFDAIWMSQFLDCFGEDEIESILKRSKTAITDNGTINILETYWDRQRFPAASYSLQMTSLYFTCIANGNSRMYHSKDMIELVQKTGLYIDQDIDNIGISHTLFSCKKK
jgi:ubiquinone/menaquinone biosynthesis C-methylase UbiE